MFLFLSKTLDYLLYPLTWALLLGGLGVLLQRRRPVVARTLGALALVVLGVFSSDKVAMALARLAEADAPRSYRPEVEYDAVLVLGGMIEPSPTLLTGQAELASAADRLTAGFGLYRTGKVANLVLSAGLIDPLPGELPESEHLRRLLIDWGVPADRVVAETKSRNTRENAVEAALLVKQRGWKRLLLVTSAAHMERALGCFHAVGLAPDTLPVDYRGGDGVGVPAFPRAQGLLRSTEILRELVGRRVYWLKGWSKSAPVNEP